MPEALLPVVFDVLVNGLVALTVLLENGDAPPNIDGGFVFDVVVVVPKMDALLLLPVLPLPANEKVGVAFEAPKDKLPKGLFCGEWEYWK